MKLLQKLKRKKGFTLVELLIVLFIIGVLVALILPNLEKARKSAKRKEAASNLRAMRSAQIVCVDSTEASSLGDCNDLGALITNNFLDDLDDFVWVDGTEIPYEFVQNSDGDFEPNYNDFFDPWPPKQGQQLVFE